MALNNTEFEKQLFILHANSPKPQKHTSIKGLHKLTEFKSKMLQRAKDFSQKNTEASLLKALSILNQHLTSNPKEPNALALKGYVLWKLYFSGVEAQLDLLLEAKNFAEKALLIDPHHSEAQGCLVRIAWDQGKTQEALQHAVNSLSGCHPDESQLLVLARALHNSGLSEHCLPILEQLSDKDNSDAITKLKVWSLCMTGHYQQCLEEGARYLARVPNENNTPYVLALCHLCLGEESLAIDTLNTALESDEEGFIFHCLKMDILRRTDDKAALKLAAKQAMNALSVKMQLYPYNYRLNLWAMASYIAVGNQSIFDRYVAEHINAIKQNGYLTYRLAHLYRQCGNVEKMKFYLLKSESLGFVSSQLVSKELTWNDSDESFIRLFLEQQVKSNQRFYEDHLQDQCQLIMECANL